MPRVSVIMPAYNGEEYIAQALQSILSQTYKDFEIVVVDDGSTDGTKDVVYRFMGNGSSNIRYVYQGNNGQSSARNRGIREASGEFVAFLDQDDLWLPEFLEKMVRKIDEGFDWVVSDNFRDGIDAETGAVSRTVQRREMYAGWNTDSLLREFLIDDRVGPPGKVVVRRSILLERDIFFDSRADNREDWDFATHLVSKGCVPGWVREPLFVYRVRSDNSNASRRRDKTLYATFYVVEKYTDAFLRSDLSSVLAEHYFGLARRFWGQKRDLKKFALCMMRQVRYGGVSGLLSLMRRKMGFSRNGQSVRGSLR